MAVLSKHGAELYRYEGLTSRISWRSDGEILRDTGGGWKLFKRVKAGANPLDVANRQRERNELADRDQPSFVAFRELMHELVQFKARHWVLTAIQLMPDDPDGVCVELDESSLRYSDHNPELTLDDCVQLCRAFKAAELEAQARKAAQPA